MGGGETHTHTEARTHTHARTHARTHAHTHTRARERTHARTRIHIRTERDRQTDRQKGERVRDTERSSNDAVSSHVDAVQLPKQCINKNLFLLPYNASSLYVDRHSLAAEKELKTHVSFDRQQCFLLWSLTTFG